MLTKNVLHIFHKNFIHKYKISNNIFFFDKIRSDEHFIGRIFVIGIIKLIFYAYLKIFLN